MNQIKLKDMKGVKEALLVKQDFLCPICTRDLRTLKSRDICLDHNHVTGEIRAVLCRGCNSLEGKYYRAFVRVGHRNQGVDYTDVLLSLARYYDFPPETGLIHPKFKEKK